MYTLTLNKGERKAIDWVGHRNWNGDSLYKTLWVGCHYIPHDAEWSDNCDITFYIAECEAWDIKECWESEGREIPHFSNNLKGKILSLIESIV